MEEFSPQKFPRPEHSSFLDFCQGPRVQTGLDLLQPPGSVQLEHLLVHRADQLLQELQGLFQSVLLLFTPCGSSQLHEQEDAGATQRFKGAPAYL